jgi:type IV secretory pathway VirB10-like protein
MKAKPAIRRKGRSSKPVIVEGVIVEGVFVELDEETESARDLRGAVDFVAGLTKAAGLGGFLAGLALVTHRAIQSSIDARQRTPAPTSSTPTPAIKLCWKCRAPLPPHTPLEGEWLCAACYDKQRQAEAEELRQVRERAAAAAEQRRAAEAADAQRAAQARQRAADAEARARAAAALLGVGLDESEPAIKEAFKRKMRASIGAGQLHDEAAAGIDPADKAQPLISAKNTLLERARRAAARS